MRLKLLNVYPPIGSENTVLIMQYFRVALKMDDKTRANLKGVCVYRPAMVFVSTSESLCKANQLSLIHHTQQGNNIISDVDVAAVLSHQVGTQAQQACVLEPNSSVVFGRDITAWIPLISIARCFGFPGNYPHREFAKQSKTAPESMSPTIQYNMNNELVMMVAIRRGYRVVKHSHFCTETEIKLAMPIITSLFLHHSLTSNGS
jgi:hypothetical protein